MEPDPVHATFENQVEKQEVPPSNAGYQIENNGCNNSIFAMPCTELAHLTRKARHAFTPPDTPANMGKPAEAVAAGRVLPAWQLQHSGYIEGIFLLQASSLYPVLCPNQNPLSPAILLWQKNPLCTATLPLWAGSFNSTQPPLTA